MPTDRVIRPAVSADRIVPADRLVGDVLRRHAAAQPDAVAWVTASRSWTYAQADAAANRIANGLAALGVARGERVACLTRHGAECTLLMVAASRIGAVCAPLNWRLAGPEVQYVIGHSEARFVVVDKEFLPTLKGGDLPLMKLTVLTDGDGPGEAAGNGMQGLHDWLARFDAVDPRRDSAAGDTALQLYSSGTTGLPKGVEITHRGLLTACRSYAIVCKIDADTVMLNALPSFHIAGVENTLTTLIEGGRTLHHAAFDPKAAIDTITRDRISHVFLVPAMMLFVLQHPNAATADFSSLRMVAATGATRRPPTARSPRAAMSTAAGCAPATPAIGAKASSTSTTG